MRERLPALILLVLLLCGTVVMAAPKERSPSARDKCPVCGMFVGKYPNWIASARTKDGKTYFYDGPKDMFSHYFDPGHYTPGKVQGDIIGLSVKEDYSLETIDARKAFFVSGSDVHGPMGGELIPFGSQKDAALFLKDHKGKKILRFSEITPQAIKDLN